MGILENGKFNYNAGPNRVMSPDQVNANTSPIGFVTKFTCFAVDFTENLWAADPFAGNPPALGFGPKPTATPGGDARPGYTFTAALTSFTWDATSSGPMTLEFMALDAKANSLKTAVGSVAPEIKLGWYIADYSTAEGKWFDAFGLSTLTEVDAQITQDNKVSSVTVGNPTKVMNGTASLTPIKVVLAPPGKKDKTFSFTYGVDTQNKKVVTWGVGTDGT